MLSQATEVVIATDADREGSDCP
ncbi:hypothetical protein WBU87_26700 [Escherichia coli]